MRSTITPEELAQLTAFASDDKADVDPAAVQKLCSLHAAVTAHLAKRFAGLQKRNALLGQRLDTFKEKRTERFMQEGYDETGLDSCDVAWVLLYHLQQMHTWRLNKSKVILILYEMYCSWLSSKQQRLFLEHPVATEYGPMFWRVYKRIQTEKSVPYTKVAWLKEVNPGVAVYCENAARKYYDYDPKTLEKLFLKSKPYRMSTKEHNGGKWNKEIDDHLIREWMEQERKTATEK